MVRAMKPAPMKDTVVGRARPWLNWSAASTAEAAVRAAEIKEDSRQAIGNPVAASFRMVTADERGNPDATFPGQLLIHLMPLTGASPVRALGRAMIRFCGRSGNVRK